MILNLLMMLYYCFVIAVSAVTIFIVISYLYILAKEFLNFLINKNKI
jgi:hypothetical protein